MPDWSDDPDVAVDEATAMAAYHEQRYDDALGLFGRLYDASRGDASAQPRLAYCIGLSLMALERTDEAVAWLEEAAHHPDADAEVKDGAQESLRYARSAAIRNDSVEQ